MSKRPAFPAPVMITTSEAVASLCEKLRHESFVTIDTEFVREKTYWPKLCLVQLGGEEDVAIIDACAPGIDLAPLAALLAEPTCTKVFHAARQDLEIFLHLFGRLPVNVFDTQIAAMVAGFGEQVGYDSLVGSITGQSIDKTHRFSDWAARPLTPAQISYASADVTHLRDVYRQLRDQLKAQERVHWVEAEQAILSEEKTFRPDPRRLWEKLKARTHNRRVLAILRELAAWRELAAQRVDMPRQRLVRDESLLEIAAVKPRHAKALARIRGVSAEFAAGALGHELLEAIEIGESVPEDDLPAVPYKKRSERPRPAQGVVALLKVLLSARCETHRVAARLVATSDELERLALGETELPVLHGWRRDVFGKEALSLLAGEVSLSICEGKLHVEETS
ncbi:MULTISPECIES: ribonuclease D [unclassified Saccharibacter]|uniref:ribonuclease D n=1 Tax=unclassified Saccharibacter TaxID=2648722 RepID=UPI00132C8520|nr:MULTISPECIES: ribonuclease D [unclassified Saccharibacter]MXV36624.1 ribonuclease D [Saccharibacter sp. EH611]MXV58816.1 ribonuclease D [Saccharibacter sp. EH70]MXV65572.1 ribonuclease D [Saccharibacter sp. EH60]